MFELLEDEFSIGRDESNSLCLTDELVSRRHCVIRRDGLQFRIRDLDSANWTPVNGQPVSDYMLAHGDQIEVGSSRFVFLLEDSNLSSPPVDKIISVTSTTVLRPAEAVYLQPHRVVDAAVQSGQAAQHLKTMLQAAAAISAAPGLRALQQELMESLVQAVSAQRGAIVLADEGKAVHHWNRSAGSDQSFHVPRGIVGRVLEEGMAVCLNDVLLAGLPMTHVSNGSDSVVSHRINSVLAAPVNLGDQRLAVIYLDTCEPKIRFNEDHLQLVTGIAGMAAAPLANALRLERLEDENRRLEAELHGEHDMVGSSDRMRDVYRFVRKTGPTNSTVLVCGESGTGKELVARAVHRISPRAKKPFVAINCAAVTETLLESEFFGHERGAFTGAVTQKRGKLEEADGGTVFLDEIGELAGVLQAKLLRVLQEREFERVGGTRSIKVDLRIIAATNRDLEEMVRRGEFRQDLYYRLNVVSLTLPPLRERRDDIMPLANYILRHQRLSPARKILGFSPEARACIMNYNWPGNVRELQNAVERAVVLGTEDEILADDLPESIVQAGGGEAVSGVAPGGRFHETIRNLKRQLVLKAFDQANQSHAEAAKILGLHPNNLHRLIKNLNMKANK
jgi:transcriptional regulator with GAF, ATPase, and Fis domain